MMDDLVPLIPFVRLDVSGIDDPEAAMAVVLYAAGCPRRCPGCHNPGLQEAGDHPLRSAEEVISYLERFFARDEAFTLIEAVVFQGGDWAEYPIVYCAVALWLRVKGFRTVLYTGEVFENLPEHVRETSDWVIDGPWEEDKPSVFPPSINQRVFHRGQRVDPEQLPLYRHLLESRFEVGKEEPGRLG